MFLRKCYVADFQDNVKVGKKHSMLHKLAQNWLNVKILNNN